MEQFNVELCFSLFFYFCPKLLFEMIEISSLAVHVTRERFRRCLSESLSSNGRTQTNPANEFVKINEKNEKLDIDKGIKIQLEFIIIIICSHVPLFSIGIVL